MRNHTDRLIDWGPMGCQTGFYANKVQCGWGANHCLTAAQDAVRAFLDAREEWDQVLA